MAKVQKITVQTAPANAETGNPGAVFVGYYVRKGATLTVTDKDGAPVVGWGGQHIQQTLQPGENERQIASRLVKRASERAIATQTKAFSQPIRYPPTGGF